MRYLRILAFPFVVAVAVALATAKIILAWMAFLVMALAMLIIRAYREFRGDI